MAIIDSRRWRDRRSPIRARRRALPPQAAAEAAHRAALFSFLDAVNVLDDPRSIMMEAVSAAGRALKVNRCGFSEISDDGSSMSFRVCWSDGTLEPLTGSIDIRLAGEAALETLRAGRTLAIPRGDPRAAATPPAWRTMGTRASVSVPLVLEGRYAASLWVHQAVDRSWTAEEIRFLEDVAARTWDAVKRARAEEALRRLNGTLQQQVDDQTRQLREQETRWRRLFVRMQEGLMMSQVLRDEGGRVADWRFLEVNPAWEALFGVAREAVVGRTLSEGPFPPGGLTLERIEGMLASGAQTRFSGLAPQTGRYYEADAFPVDEDRFAVVFLDATEQRRAKQALERLNQTLEEGVKRRTAELEAAQEALRQAQKMEALGQLTGGIAHDFNNLLAGISGSLEMLSTRLAEGRLDASERYIETAQGAARRAAALTHRLLAFSRRQTLTPVPTDVDRLVEGLEELLRRAIGPAVEMQIRRGEGLWTTYVDPHQLENALLNLCINARDAMPGGGRLRIGATNRAVEATEAAALDVPEGDYVVLSVADTGVGMAPEVIARAFDPFFTTKPIGQGTGLGLSMVYGFVRQSGGQVRVVSEPGRGAEVLVYLPRRDGEADRTADGGAGEAMASGSGRGAVLVVDDEPSVRLFVVDVMREAGFTVLEAENGEAALRRLDEGPIELVISDVGLPGGLNGRQVADAVLSRHREAKVVLITGYAEASVLGSGELGPAITVLTKPFSLDALSRAVRTLLDAPARTTD